ncbi:hypothetical protein BJ170DRAFT_618390 [Xylariales sp. AK1849]|nr:hypothetical protein BJ170DRAFT_618390 [Xylariales sp. AK1849]
MVAGCDSRILVSRFIAIPIMLSFSSGPTDGEPTSDDDSIILRYQYSPPCVGSRLYEHSRLQALRVRRKREADSDPTSGLLFVSLVYRSSGVMEGIICFLIKSNDLTKHV